MKRGAWSVLCVACSVTATPATLDFGLWTVAPGLRHIRPIGGKREEEEEGAQHILPFGDPSYRFNMQWVEREQRRDHTAAPQAAGHVPEQEKKQKCVGDVVEQARQVMPARPHPIELAIEHMRQHRDRVPVACDVAVPLPSEALRAQARLHVRIRGDIIGVVVVDEVMPRNRPIDHQRAQRQEQADPEGMLPG